MGLFINGSRGGMNLTVDHSDFPVIHGTGIPEISISPQGISGEVPARVRRTECHWSILSPSHADIDIDGSLAGLLPRVRTSPNTRHGMVKYFSERPELLGV